MTVIVRKFQSFGGLKSGKTRQFSHGEASANAYGSETRANSLRDEYDEMERETERVVGQTLQIIERERVREGER